MSRPIPHHTAKPGFIISEKPGLLRRIAAICYDSFLLIAVLFFATALLLPFNNGVAFTPDHPFYPFYLLYLLAISFAFYGWFWIHGGQTLGMRAWKIRVLTLDQQPITWRQAAFRFVCALLSWAVFGIGYLWIVFDKNRFSWHDHLSKTAIFFHRPPKSR